jgi:hypothetical protein
VADAAGFNFDEDLTLVWEFERDFLEGKALAEGREDGAL